jgi:hypothetical protein
MKRYMHAWIAVRAIDRLGAIAEQYEAKDPEKGEALKYFQVLLKENINLVVEGSWLPDNVIRDNRDGHIWKYEPLLKAGEEGRYRRYHEDTLSLLPGGSVHLCLGQAVGQVHGLSCLQMHSGSADDAGHDPLPEGRDAPPRSDPDGEVR